MGDHMCYYSDLTKIYKHYPKFVIKHSLKEIIKQIVESEKKEITLNIKQCNK